MSISFEADPNAAPRRKFTILDGMVLIAASAPAILLWTWQLDYHLKVLSLIDWRSLLDPYYWHTFMFGTRPFALQLFLLGAEFWFPILVFWTFAVFGLRWLRPRPAWPELARQPGISACGAASLAMFAMLWFTYFKVDLPPYVVPGAVGLAWLGLGLSRAWPSEPTWIDRLGRLLGVAWLGTAPLILSLYW